MKRFTYSLLFGLPLSMGLGACHPKLPHAIHDTVLYKTFSTSYDETWKAVLAIAGERGAQLISAEKTSGLISFREVTSEEGSEVFFNVFLEQSTLSGGTVVYAFPRNRRAFERTGAGAVFFDRLSSMLANDPNA